MNGRGSNDDERRRRASRRAWLAIAGGAMGAFAGCNALDSPTEDPENDGDGGSRTLESASPTDVPGATDRETTTEEPDGTTTGRTLEVVHWWTGGRRREAIDALLEGFRSETDTRVEGNPAPGGIRSANSAEMRDLVREDPPGAFQTWPGAALDPYASAGLLAGVDGVWAEGMRRNYPEAVQRLAKRDGDYVAVPLSVYRLNNLFYNQSVLDEAGVDPSALALGDPAELLAAMEAVERETDAVGLALQTASPWSTTQLWETVFLAHESALALPELLSGEARTFEDGVRRSLETVREALSYVPPEADRMAWSQANEMLVEGDAAFVHEGSWAATQYRSRTNFDYQSDWGHVAFPDTGRDFSMVLEAFVEPAESPTPVNTDRFLSYCGTVDAQERFNTRADAVPVRTDVSDRALDGYRASEYSAYRRAQNRLPTVTHGTGVDPATRTEILTAIDEFVAGASVDETATRIVAALDG